MDFQEKIQKLKVQIRQAEDEGDDEEALRLRRLLKTLEFENAVQNASSGEDSSETGGVGNKKKKDKKDKKDTEDKNDEDNEEEDDEAEEDEDNKEEENENKEDRDDDNDGNDNNTGENKENIGSKENTNGATKQGGKKAAEGGGKKAAEEGSKKAAEEGAKQVAKEGVKQGATQAATQAGGTAAAAGTAATPVGWIILIIIAIIVLIIIIVGIFTAIQSMPGLLTGKLKNIGNQFIEGLLSLTVTEQAEAQINQEDLNDVANYIEEMGLDLKGFGFLSEEVASTETSEDGSITYKDADGDVLLKKEKDENGENKITYIDSKYLVVYLAADNKLYLLSNQNFNFIKYLKDWGPLKDIVSDDSSAWGSGMIYLDKNDWTDGIEKYSTALGSLRNTIADKISKLLGAITGTEMHIDIGFNEIARIENQKLIIKTPQKFFGIITNPFDLEEYEYNLDGWTTKYGMPLEFLLSLHIATMAPDFVYEVTESYDTKVHIGLLNTTAEITIVLPNGNPILDESGNITTEAQEYLAQNGLASLESDIIKEAKDINNPSMERAIPYIKKVTNHWYYNDIEFNYEEDKVWDEQIYKYESDSGDSKLEEAGLYIKQAGYIIKGGLTTDEVEKKAGSSGIIKLLKDNEYYIYDGNSRSEEKKKIEAIKMSTHAFAILEAVHSSDAEELLRMLKELFKDAELEIDTDYDGRYNVIETNLLDWIIPDYNPLVWPTSSEKPEEEYYTLINSKKVGTVGFDPDAKVITPGRGKIVEIGENNIAITFEGINIDEYDSETTANTKVDGMTIYIEGINVDSSLKLNQIIEKGTQIGTTTEESIKLLLRNEDYSIQSDVEKYLLPEAVRNRSVGGSSSQGVDLVDFIHRTESTGEPKSEGNDYIVVNDGAGIPTVGYGVAIKYNKERFRKYGIDPDLINQMGAKVPKDIVDKVEADELAAKAATVNKEVEGLGLTQYEIDALISRCYNYNVSGFREVFQKYGRDYDMLWKNFFCKPITGEGVGVMDGLKKRREAEFELFKDR